MSETKLTRVGAMLRPISTMRLLRGGSRMTLADGHRVITELADRGAATVPFRLTAEEVEALRAMGVEA